MSILEKTENLKLRMITRHDEEKQSGTTVVYYVFHTAERSPLCFRPYLP